jgi:hypothetical protein
LVWFFVFHQLGGWARMHYGDYQYAFLTGASLGLIAACLALTVDRRNIERPEVAMRTELISA